MKPNDFQWSYVFSQYGLSATYTFVPEWRKPLVLLCVLLHGMKTPWSPCMNSDNIVVSLLGVSVWYLAKAIWGSIIFLIMRSKHRGLPTWVSKTSWYPFLAFWGCGAESVVRQLFHHFRYKTIICKWFYFVFAVWPQWKSHFCLRITENINFIMFFYSMGWKHRGLPTWISKASCSPFLAFLFDLEPTQFDVV